MIKSTNIKYFFIYIVMLYAYCPTMATEDLLLKQLKGEGCVFDRECGSHWSWRQNLTVNRPEANCPVMAAMCLRYSINNEDRVIKELEDAVDKYPSYINTGDGQIGFGDCISHILESIKNKTSLESSAIQCGR